MTVFPRPLAWAVAGVLAVSAAPAAVLAQPQGPQQQDLPQLLHLQPGQMGAFQALQRASQPMPDELARLRAASPQALGSLSTPERLDRIGAALATQQAMFRRSADATRTFYGQLSPDQRSQFDRLSAAPSGQGRGRPPQ